MSASPSVPGGAYIPWFVLCLQLSTLGMTTGQADGKDGALFCCALSRGPQQIPFIKLFVPIFYRKWKFLSLTIHLLHKKRNNVVYIYTLMPRSNALKKSLFGEWCMLNFHKGKITDS